jgi:hypothetical protein
VAKIDDEGKAKKIEKESKKKEKKKIRRVEHQFKFFSKNKAL